MKRTVQIFYIWLVVILLNGCSNVTIGFEEDSMFYTPPNNSNISNTKTEDSTSPTLPVKSQKIDKKETSTTPSIQKESKTIDKKEVIVQVDSQEKDEDTENETYFSYDPHDEE